jgi:hypothetical protein
MRNPLTAVLKRDADDPQYIADQAHAAVEKAAKQDLDTLAAQLIESRTRVGRASNTAVKALADLYDAAQAHDDLVRRGAEQLRGRGLAYDDVTYEAEGRTWETGGTDNGAVLLRGAWWLPLSPASVFMRAAWGAARSRSGDRADLTRRLANFFGVDRLDSRPDGLLRDSRLPEAHQTPPPIARVEPEWQSIVEGRPTGNSDRSVTYTKWPLPR